MKREISQRLGLYCAVVGGMSCAGRACAVTYTWNAVGTHSWRDTTKWSPNVGYPGINGSTNDNAVLASNLSNGYRAILDGGITVNSLQHQFGGQLEIRGTAATGDAALTVNALSSFSAELVLTSTGGPFNASFIAASGGSTWNIGSINFEAGSGGNRALTLDFLMNEGLINVMANTFIGRPGVGQLQNGNGSLGSTYVAPGATLTTNRYVQVGGATTNVHGTLDVLAGPIEFNRGKLHGSGTLGDDVIAARTRVVPASPAGAGFVDTLDVEGDFTFGDETILSVYLDAPGLSGRLAVAGDLSLPGVDTVLELQGGAVGQTYAVATYGGARTGMFDLVTPGYAVSYDTPGQVRVTVLVPEPSAAAAVFMGGVMAWNVRRRRPRKL